MSTGVPFAEFAQTLPAPEEEPPDSTVTVTSLHSAVYCSAHASASGRTVDEPAILIEPAGPQTTGCVPSSLASIVAWMSAGIGTYPTELTSRSPPSPRPNLRNGTVLVSDASSASRFMNRGLDSGL